MTKQIENNDEPKYVLGTELRDAIARSITNILPGIQFKVLARMVTEFEVELENLYNLQKEGK